MDPKERIRELAAQASVKVSDTIPAIRYYRSGAQMHRMAKIYLGEGELASAYALHIKYITLFLEEIRKHPEYASVSETEKAVVRENMKAMLPEAERLKVLLLKQFEREYEEFVKQQALKKIEDSKRELERERNIPSAPVNDQLWEPRISPMETPQILRGGLRNIYVPRKLIPKFLELARKNTQNNIETCALLTGTLHKDRLTITTLLVPEQRGTSDDCYAENDLATFNVIEERGLLTFGWIHTHPSQQAFLSSVDLHSQFGYQSMLPEAIAIVCAPKYSNETLRLTAMGLEVVGKCRQPGFHPHPGPPLFETASHAQIVDLPCEVIDLRDF